MTSAPRWARRLPSTRRALPPSPRTRRAPFDTSAEILLRRLSIRVQAVRRGAVGADGPPRTETEAYAWPSTRSSSTRTRPTTRSCPPRGWPPSWTPTTPSPRRSSTSAVRSSTGDALQPTGTATSIRGGGDDRRALRRDQGGPRRLLPRRGPRPRPRARDRQGLPGAGGGVEVRPIMEFDDRSGRTADAGARGRRTAAGVAEADVGRRSDVADALADAHRREWAFVLAATVRVAGDLDLAEECAQEAYVSALAAWERDGVAAQPRRLADDRRAAQGARRAAPRGHAAAQAAAPRGARRGRRDRQGRGGRRGRLGRRR